LGRQLVEKTKTQKPKNTTKKKKKKKTKTQKKKEKKKKTPVEEKKRFTRTLTVPRVVDGEAGSGLKKMRGYGRGSGRLATRGNKNGGTTLRTFTHPSRQKPTN